MKQLPYRELTNIWSYRTKFSWPGELGIGIRAHLVYKAVPQVPRSLSTTIVRTNVNVS